MPLAVSDGGWFPLSRAAVDLDSTPVYPAEGGSVPDDEADSTPDLQRTSGEPFQLDNGLTVVRLGAGHPAASLPLSTWTNPCERLCAGIDLL